MEYSFNPTRLKIKPCKNWIHGCWKCPSHDEEDFILNHTIIKRTNTYFYLGSTITSDCKIEPETNNRIAKYSKTRQSITAYGSGWIENQKSIVYNNILWFEKIIQKSNKVYFVQLRAETIWQCPSFRFWVELFVLNKKNYNVFLELFS